MLKQKKIDLIMSLFLTKKSFYIIYRTIKKSLKKFGLRTWCTKEPFGYRVVLLNFIYKVRIVG